LKPELVDAYKKARYVVFLERELVLRIGEPSERLDALLQGATAAFVTAANPQSHKKSTAENHAAHLELVKSMAGKPWRCYPAEGRDPAGQWREEGLLIAGIPRAEAEALGRSLGQNAIVFVQSRSAPELAVLV
jgi:hypothetical protein